MICSSLLAPEPEQRQPDNHHAYFDITRLIVVSFTLASGMLPNGWLSRPERLRRTDQRRDRCRAEDVKQGSPVHRREASSWKKEQGLLARRVNARRTRAYRRAHPDASFSSPCSP